MTTTNAAKVTSTTTTRRKSTKVTTDTAGRPPTKTTKKPATKAKRDDTTPALFTESTTKPATKTAKRPARRPVLNGKAFIFDPRRDEPTADVVWVTPEMAEQWLEMNEHNRNVRNAAVNGWAVDMSLDEWKLNGETIKFTRSGLLIDGQHRVMAIIASGNTVQSFIAMGLDEDAQDTVDIGISRPLHDILKLRGEKNHIVVGSVTRRVYLWRMRVDRAESLDRVGIEIMEHSITEAAQETSNLHFKRQPASTSYLLKGAVRPTSTQLIKLLDSKEGPAIRAAAAEGTHARKSLRMSAAVMGLCYYLFARLDADDAKEFFYQVVEGDSITKGDPAFALRRVLGDMTGRYTREEVATALWIKAWNYWQEGVRMDVCSWRAGGRSPEPFPIPYKL